MRISDLKRNDVIILCGRSKRIGILAIVDDTGGTNKENGFTFGQKLNWKMVAKSRLMIVGFEKVNVPFTRKVDMQEEQDMVHEPPHYQFGKFSARMIIELVGKTYKSASVFYHVGNALKYLMRAPRKNGLQDLKKAKQSVEFAIENWEAEENGI